MNRKGVAVDSEGPHVQTVHHLDGGDGPQVGAKGVVVHPGGHGLHQHPSEVPQDGHRGHQHNERENERANGIRDLQLRLKNEKKLAGENSSTRSCGTGKKKIIIMVPKVVLPKNNKKIIIKKNNNKK